MLEETHTPVEAPSSTSSNVTTEAELLSRAKTAIEAGVNALNEKLHDAAEALAVAHELHGTSQAAMAQAVGKSEAWVSLLLKWRSSGYKGDSPFGPKTKAGRLKHAKDRATAGTSKPRKSRKPNAASGEPNPTTSVNTETSPRADAGTSASAEAGTAISKKPSPAEAKGNLMYAIEHWWRYLDDASKVEVTKYFFQKTGARVS